MFQEKEKEAYQKIKAPIELKNQIQLSVQKERKRLKKQRTTLVATVASIAFITLCSNVLPNKNTILSINHVAVSFESIELENPNAFLRTASEQNEQALQISVPLEIDVKEQAHIKVSEGTLQQSVETEYLSKQVTELNITEKTVIDWIVKGNTNRIPTCTITTENKTYQYVIEFDDKTSVYTIKQVNYDKP